MTARLAVAVGASAAVVACAPVIGQIRGALQAALPDQYLMLLVAVVAGAIGGGLVWAIVRIRDRRPVRYGLLAAALAGGGVYASVMATGNANVDAVERFHFVEYGVLTLLFYRAWRARRDSTVVLLPLLAAFVVGTLDEGVQWFVPLRVGEWRDVLLNLAAITCGLLFGLGLEPPISLSLTVDVTRRRALAVMMPLALLLFAVFFYAVHVGHEVRDPDIGTFHSRYRAEELLALSAERARQWQASPPTALRRYSREDQYMAEALWHVQRRNQADTPGGMWAQWKENQILEKYFSPILEYPTYNTPRGARWPDAQREQVRAAAERDARPFVSDAHPIPIYDWTAMRPRK